MCYVRLYVDCPPMEQNRQLHNCGIWYLHCVAEGSLIMVYYAASLDDRVFMFRRSVVLPSSRYGVVDEPVTQSDFTVERNPQAYSRWLSPDTLHCMEPEGQLLPLRLRWLQSTTPPTPVLMFLFFYTSLHFWTFRHHASKTLNFSSLIITFLESRWGGEIFSTRPDRPWGPPSLLYNGYRVFPRGKAAWAWRWPLTPLLSSAEVEGRVELYICSPSGPSWPVLGWTLSFIFTFTLFLKICDLQGKVASASAGCLFHSFIVLFTKEYSPISVLCSPKFCKSHHTLCVTTNIRSLQLYLCGSPMRTCIGSDNTEISFFPHNSDVTECRGRLLFRDSHYISVRCVDYIDACCCSALRNSQ